MLAELTAIPVATTLIGRGSFPEDHPLALGTTGIWGTEAANRTTLDADVILAIGTGFGEADCSSWNRDYTFSIPPTRLIQIDTDPQEIGKIYPAEVGIVGDARETLRKLIENLQNQPRSNEPHSARLAEITARKREWRKSLAESQANSGTDTGMTSGGTNKTWPDQNGGFFFAVAGEMLKQGFAPDEISKIAGGNFCRVFGKVTHA